MLFLSFSPLVSWALSAGAVSCRRAGCVLAVESSFLSVCGFPKALVAVLKFVVIAKERKY